MSTSIPGRMRIEWRDNAVFGQESTAAAAAGRAAAAQGKFWEFNRAVFAAAPEWDMRHCPTRRLVHYAEQVDMPDPARFDADMHSSTATNAVQTDLEEASALGVPSTPAFVINGNPLLGAQPVETFQTAIDAALGGGQR